jgi:TRAP transporter TAXI family solute receptor
MKSFSAILAAAVAIIVAAGMGAAPDQPQTRMSFQIATGASAGTYYPVGQMLASLISHPPGIGRCSEAGRCGPLGLLAAARVSEGSVANARAVNSASVSSALIQSEVAANAFAGEQIFKPDGPQTKLRAIAALFPEFTHVVVAKSANIRKVADLHGKRVSIDSAGSGSHALARRILSAARIGDKELKLSFENAEISADKIVKGELDAFFFVGGPPLELVTELTQTETVELLNLEGPAIEALLKDKNIARAMIPADTYPNVPMVKTVAVNALWVVNADLPEDLIYSITAALWNDANRSLIDSGHAIGRLIRPETARVGVSIPLHPGAERFYAEMDARSAPQQ